MWMAATAAGEKSGLEALREQVAAAKRIQNAHRSRAARGVVKKKRVEINPKDASTFF